PSLPLTDETNVRASSAWAGRIANPMAAASVTNDVAVLLIAVLPATNAALLLLLEHLGGDEGGGPAVVETVVVALGAPARAGGAQRVEGHDRFTDHEVLGAAVLREEAEAVVARHRTGHQDGADRGAARRGAARRKARLEIVGGHAVRHGAVDRARGRLR